jgi:hypothetical protein
MNVTPMKNSRTDQWFGKTLAEYNNEINESFLHEYCEHLEQKPVFDATSWGWLGIFAQQSPMALRLEFQQRANNQFQTKPYACLLCGEKEATHYHIQAGQVCVDCFDGLPKE